MEGKCSGHRCCFLDLVMMFAASIGARNHSLSTRNLVVWLAHPVVVEGWRCVVVLVVGC